MVFEWSILYKRLSPNQVEVSSALDHQSSGPFVEFRWLYFIIWLINMCSFILLIYHIQCKKTCKKCKKKAKKLKKNHIKKHYGYHENFHLLHIYFVFKSKNVISIVFCQSETCHHALGAPIFKCHCLKKSVCIFF